MPNASDHQQAKGTPLGETTPCPPKDKCLGRTVRMNGRIHGWMDRWTDEMGRMNPDSAECLLPRHTSLTGPPHRWIHLIDVPQLRLPESPAAIRGGHFHRIRRTKRQTRVCRLCDGRGVWLGRVAGWMNDRVHPFSCLMGAPQSESRWPRRLDA